MKNNGDRDELIFKFAMIALRDHQGSLFGEKVDSVGFGGVEYRSLPDDFDFATLKGMTDTDLKSLARRQKISKAAASDKSDIYINGKGISLKSLRAAPPALVNHTARPGFEFACSHSGADIAFLDKAVDEYWDLRLSGVIKEDIKNSDPNCPFALYKEQLKPIVEYFLFEGTGSKLSKHPACGIIEFDDPFDSATYKYLSPEDAFASVWDKLIFSMRAKKGMPRNYNPDKYVARGANGKAKAESIKKWVRYTSGDYRGALHIRYGK